MDLTNSERSRLALKDLTAAEKIAEYCMQNGIRVIPYSDEDYPYALRTIEDPPIVLYLRGSLPDWNVRPCIGVIGTRSMSYYGGESTFDIAYDLARMGCITVSGMALGVDGVCAGATLQAKGTTVAVLGSGLDVIYPPEHSYLYECILANGGAVISEFHPHERPEGFHFPIRNRIISGLSRAVIVVEGEAGSGSLITARRAAAQGRMLFAVPGQIGSANSEGPLLLLKHRKASPLTCADDIYDSLRDDYLPYINAFKLLETRESTLEKVMQKYQIVCAKPKVKKLDEAKAKEDVEQLENHRKNGPNYKKRGKAFGFLRKIGSALADDMPKEDDNAHREKTEKAIREKELAFMKDMSEIEQKIYKQMPYGEEVSAEAIVLSDMDTAEILSVLSEMELSGFVSSTRGGVFKKNIE